MCDSTPLIQIFSKRLAISSLCFYFTCFMPLSGTLSYLSFLFENMQQWGTRYSSYLDTMFCLLAAAAKLLESCPTLCNPIDGSPSGSPVPGILQARTLEWVAISFSNAWKWKVKVAQSCLTLSNPMDCSPPGFSVHGILQARVPEWGAIAFYMSSGT